MPGNLAAWKKAKPLTLGKEPLTAALKDLDTAVAAFEKEPTREAIAALSGAAKNAGRANAETLTVCSPQRHKQGMAYLERNGKNLDTLIAAVKADQIAFAGLLGEIVKRKDVVVKAMLTSASKPGLSVATVGKKQAEDFGKWLNANATKVTSKEVTFVVIKTTRAKDCLGELIKILSASPVNQAHVAGITKELAGVAKELAAPVKFMDAKLVGARSGAAARVV